MESHSLKILIIILGLISFIPKKIVFNSIESLKQHQKLFFNKKNNLIYIANGVDYTQYKMKTKP